MTTLELVIWCMIPAALGVGWLLHWLEKNGKI